MHLKYKKTQTHIFIIATRCIHSYLYINCGLSISCKMHYRERKCIPSFQFYRLKSINVIKKKVGHKYIFEATLHVPFEFVQLYRTRSRRQCSRISSASMINCILLEFVMPRIRYGHISSDDSASSMPSSAARTTLPACSVLACVARPYTPSCGATRRPPAHRYHHRRPRNS